MAYKNGIPSNNAANAPFLYKNGLLVTPSLMDTAVPNAWQDWALNPDGDSKLPTFVGADANGVTQLSNPNGVNAAALSTTQLSTPAAPTITNAGTAGAVTWSYKVVAFSGNGTTLGSTPASAAGSTTTGNATLTSANYNIVTWARVTGAAFYKIYRTAAGTTPSTTGEIAQVDATIENATGLQPATYVLNDTALTADGTTAPTTNTTGAVSFPVIGGGFNVPALPTPVGGTVTVNGTAGAVTVTYKIVALAPSGGRTAASANITTTTANATLSATNSLTVDWDEVPGASGYQVWRTAAGGTPSSTGLIGTTAAGVVTFTDTGLAGDSATAPTVNTTGGISVARLDNSGASVFAQGVNYVTAGGSNNAITVTLQNSAGTNIAQAAGLRLMVLLANSLQAGANTLALNGAAAANIRSHRNPANNIGTAYVSGGIIELVFDGTQYQDLSQ
jgi:hypothetical protein